MAGAQGSTSPVVVAKRKLINQTATIPTTTIFTPARDGVYRISAYATVTKADTTSQAWWYLTLAWTDDAGYENEGSSEMYWNSVGSLGQFFNNSLGNGTGGLVQIIEAKSGTPITFAMLQANGSSENSAYSLYYTLELLE